MCASYKRCERAVAVPVAKKDFSGHTCSVGISDIHLEVELRWFSFSTRNSIPISILNMDHLPSPSLLSGNWLAQRELIDVGHVEFYQCCLRMPREGKWEKQTVELASRSPKLFCNTSASSFQWALVSHFLIPTFVHSLLWWQTSLSRLTPPYQPWRQSASGKTTLAAITEGPAGSPQFAQ